MIGRIMSNKDSQLIYEAYDERFERDLNALRASLEQGRLGVVLTDVFRDGEYVDDEGPIPVNEVIPNQPVKVTYKMLQRPLIKELEDGSRIPNFVGHWSQPPGEGRTRVAHGLSIQHALMYDSPLSTAARKIGPETNVPQTMSYIIVNVDRDKKYGAEIEHKQAMNKSAAADAAKWKYD